MQPSKLGACVLRPDMLKCTERCAREGMAQLGPLRPDSACCLENLGCGRAGAGGSAPSPAAPPADQASS